MQPRWTRPLVKVNRFCYHEIRRGNWLTTNTFDAANRLIETTQGGTTRQPIYNGLGDRTAQTSSGQETRYTLDPTGLAQVLIEATNSQTNVYLSGLAQDQGDVWVYQLPDHLGSVRQVVDGAGQVMLGQSYDPFGSLIEQSGSGASGFGFTGEQEDASAGLVFLRARYYDPAVGRFISRDLFPGFDQRPATQHAYIYVTNNPVHYVDPSGHQGVVPGVVVSCFGIALIIPEPFTEVGCTLLLALGLISAAPSAAEIALGIIEWPESAAPFRDVPAPGVTPIPGPRPLPVPEPQRAPQPQPDNQRGTRLGPDVYPVPRSTPTPPNQCSGCDPVAFRRWWNGLPEAGSVQPGIGWYDYEQRVARGFGTMGGNRPRRVPAGTDTIDADGANPNICLLLEAKFSPNPDITQFREDGPGWVIDTLSGELRRYRLAITTPNSIPGAQPTGLMIITNLEKNQTFFEKQLISNGFILNIDGFVAIVP